MQCWLIYLPLRGASVWKKPTPPPPPLSTGALRNPWSPAGVTCWGGIAKPDLGHGLQIAKSADFLGMPFGGKKQTQKRRARLGWKRGLSKRRLVPSGLPPIPSAAAGAEGRSLQTRRANGGGGAGAGTAAPARARSVARATEDKARSLAEPEGERARARASVQEGKACSSPPPLSHWRSFPACQIQRHLTADWAAYGDKAPPLSLTHALAL